MGSVHTSRYHPGFNFVAFEKQSFWNLNKKVLCIIDKS